MGLGRMIKFAIFEVLQFAGLCLPLLIIMQRFAAIIAKVKTSARPPGDGSTAYWLIVASSIAYVTSIALLIWVPLKSLVFMKKKFLVGRKNWRPVALVYVILSTLPCFAFLIASSEVQINNNMKHDTFTELPVSLVLFSLICIDVVERIRCCRLTGQGERSTHTFFSNIHKKCTVPGQTVPNPAQPGPSRLNNRNQNGSGARLESNGTVLGVPGTNGRPFTISGLSPLDARADEFVDSFMFWMDTVEMVRVAGHPLVFYSGWVFPIYIFSYISCLRVVVMPHSPLLSSMGVALQDLPFFFVRAGLIALFGFVTPILYLMKNLLICLAFVYFNFMTKLRVFNTERVFF
uniref:Transmembrane protein 236 n=1 Tax=Oryzias sinensis TaxID=183150 RepID=A0A8C7YAH5_9TELE